MNQENNNLPPEQSRPNQWGPALGGSFYGISKPKPPKIPRWKIGLGIFGVFLMLFFVLFSREIGNLLNFLGTKAQKPGGPEITLSLTPDNDTGGPTDEVKYTINIQIEHGTYFNAGDINDPRNGGPLPFYGTMIFRVDDLVNQYPEFIESAIITVPENIPPRTDDDPNNPMITFVEELDQWLGGIGFFNRRLSPSDIPDAPDYGFVSNPPILTIKLTDYALEHGGGSIPFQINANTNYMPALGLMYVAPPPGSIPSVSNPPAVTGILNLEGGIPDFSLVVTPKNQEVYWGDTALYDVKLKSLDGFAGNIRLTSADLGGYLGTYLDNFTFDGNFDTLIVPLAVDETKNVELGIKTTAGLTEIITIEFLILGDEVVLIPGPIGIHHEDGATLVIKPPQDYTLAVFPDTQAIAPGGTAIYTIKLTRLYGFVGDVTLTTDIAIPLNPNLQSVIFSDTVLSIGDPDPTLTLVANIPNPDVTIPFIVFGDTPDLNGSPAQRQATAELRIVNTPDYTIEVIPNSQSVLAGATATYTVTIHPINGFNEPVLLTDDLLTNFGIYVQNVTYDTNPITDSTLMHIQTKPGVTHPGFDFTVTGTSSPSGLIRFDQANLAISVIPDYSIEIAPLTRTVIPGGSASYVITLTRIGDFTGDVTLSTDLGTKLGVQSAIFTPVTLSRSTLTSTLAVIAANPTIDVDHIFVVNGDTPDLGGVPATRYTSQAHFIIANTPDFTIAIEPPKTQTVNPGGTAIYHIILTRLNGYTETIILTHNLVSPFVASAIFDDNTLENGKNDAYLTVIATDPADNSNLPFEVNGNGLVGGIPADRKDNGTFIIQNLQDYTIVIDPDSRTVSPGGVTTYTITLTRLFGFTGNVNLTTDLGSKAGVQSAVINPTVLSGGILTATLTVIANNPAANATHIFYVYGDTSNLNGNPAQRSDRATFIIWNTPDFNIQVTPNSLTVAPGGTVVYDVTLILVNGYANTVTLSNNLLSAYGAYIQSAIFDSPTLSPANLTTKLRVTARTGINNQDIIGFIVTGNGLVDGVSANRTDTADLLIRNPFDYSIAINPASRTITPGGQTTYTITLTRTFGFAGDVTLTTNLGSMPGVQSAIINPSILTGATLTAILTATAQNPTADATNTFVVFGDTPDLNGALAQRTATAQLLIRNTPDFTISVSPDIQITVPGGTVSYTVSVVRLNGMDQDINLINDLVGRPGIQSALFTDNTLSAGENTTTLTVVTNGNILVTDFNFSVMGTAIIDGNPTMHSDIAILKIVDFTIDVSPISQTIQPGQNTTYTITITRLNGLTGTINLTTDLGSKQYIQSAIFDDDSLDPVQTSTILRVTTTEPAPDITINFIVTGTVNVSGIDLSHNDTANLVLFTPTTPDFTITVEPKLQTVDSGNSTTYTVKIVRLNNFAETVSLTNNLLSGFGDYIAQATFDITDLINGGSDSTILHVTTKTIDESYLINDFVVTGTAADGAPQHSDTADLQINVIVVPPPPPPPTPDFTIEVTPNLRTVDTGGSTDYTVTVTPINNFTDRVILTHNLLSEFGDYISSVSFDVLQLDQDNDWTTIMHVTTKNISASHLLTFAVTGTAISGSPIHADDADLQINVAGSPPPPPSGGGGSSPTPTPPAPTTGGSTEDFTIQVTPLTNTTINPGQSATYQVTIIRLGGFTGPVTLSTNVLQLNLDVASAIFGKITIPTGESTTTLILVAKSNAVIDSSTIFNVAGTSETIGERDDDAPVAIVIPMQLPSTGPTAPSVWFWVITFLITLIGWQQLHQSSKPKTK
ncbi:MAG: hypothetical protein V1719_00200 [Patescibacteria group bacterium]